MFFALSKILYYFIVPSTWIAACMICACVVRKQKIKKTAFALSVLFFIIFGNKFLLNEVMMCWEYDPVPIQKVGEFTTCIILTGVTNTDKLPRDRVYFNKGADRVLHPLQLYKLGKIKKILISGGSGKLIGEKISESVELKNVLLLCGVSEEDIIVENRSVNTAENAMYTKKIIDSLHLQGPYLLVTSSYHMRRSKACFDKVKLHTEIYPVDFYSRQRTFTPDMLFIPSASSIQTWDVLFKEWVGMIMYKAMGYI
ncbi:MAG: YdcF family protein [Cytophagaceae bacterium]|nr:YdcF family protein [Cytophagaceae bacterium]MDW8456539.1 YdcF family protein [Cytophagaceae bacterium]